MFKIGFSRGLLIAGMLATSAATMSNIPASAAVSGVPTFEVSAGQLPECVRDEFTPERLALRLGFFSMSGNTKAAEASLGCAIKLWPLKVRNPTTGKIEFTNDVVGKSILSAALLAVLQLDPVFFFEEMSGHQEVLDDWLTDVGPSLFTWYDPPPCRPEARRKRIILVIQSASVSPKAEPVRQQTLEAFRSMRCYIGD